MSLKLNGATSGSIELDVPDAIGSDVTGVLLPTAAGTLDRLERAGNILQVVQNHVTSTQSNSVTGNTQVSISGLNQSIIPTFASSKILVRVRWNGEFNNSQNQNCIFYILRDGSAVGLPAASGARHIGLSGLFQGYWDSDAASTQDSSWFEYLDSPNTTSSVTYQLAMLTSDNGTIFTNRTGNNTDAVSSELLTSDITLIEVAA